MTTDTIHPTVTSVTGYPAPQDRPLTYPGQRPPKSFVVSRGMVYPFLLHDGSVQAGEVFVEDDRRKSIDDFLDERGVAPLVERFAVIGYGSNPVPGQLVSTFGEDTVVPVVYGGMERADVVYNLISNQGYAYAELALGGKVRGNVGVTFLDEEQLELMVATDENYTLALAPGAVHLASGEVLERSYLFAGFRKVWVSQRYGKPVALKALPSEGRTLPELSQWEVLELVIQEFRLATLDIRTPDKLAHYVRRQQDMPEKSGKLKYDLQHEVDLRTNSRPALVDQVTLTNSPRPYA